MANVNKVTSLRGANDLYTFLSSFNNSLLNVTFTSGVISLNIEDVATISLPTGDSNYIQPTVTYNGTSTTFPSSASIRWQEGLNISMAVSDNLVFVKFDTLVEWSSNRGATFLYVKNTSEHFFGYVTNNDNPDFHAIPLTDGNGGSSYYIKPILSYIADSGCLDYINKGFVFLATTKFAEMPELVSCTTIVADSSISLPDGRNFYALGTNTLIEIDPES